MRPMYTSLFGNKVAELCLLYIVDYGEGYIRERRRPRRTGKQL